MRRPWLMAILVATTLPVTGIGALLATANHADTPIDLEVDFDQYHFGSVPQEFSFDATGSAGPVLTEGEPFWRVYEDLFAPSAPFAMIQASTLAASDNYPIALLNGASATDPSLSVYIKVMGGNLDKSAGLLWRVQDKNNYYAALASALDHKLHLLRMSGGQPHELDAAFIPLNSEFEQSQPSPTHGWYELQVEATGSHIIISFQGQKVIETTDDKFTGSGQFGVITHADTVALFDNFQFRAGQLTSTRTPKPSATPILPPIMHVLAIFTTDTGLRASATFTKGGEINWAVEIVDPNNNPIPAADVEVTMLDPDGKTVSSTVEMTGTSGLARFKMQTDLSSVLGTYTLRVTKVTNADMPDAAYDQAANVVTSTTFVLR